MYLILNKTQADTVRGNHGNYSELNPILLPDGTYALPEDCKDDPDLIGVKDQLEVVSDIRPIPKLPAMGGLCEAGKLYYYHEGTEGGYSGFVKCVQTHNRTEHAVETIPALFSFFRENSDTLEWIENEYVYIGWKRIYQGIQYEVIQEHMTLNSWTPTATLSTFWRSLAPPSAEWQVGVAYKVNDIVTYNNKIYKCLQAHTSISTWYPSAVPALWGLQ